MGKNLSPPPQTGGGTEPVNLRDALEERYLAYALSTIMGRALPDARLQLVHGAGHHLPRRAPDSVADAIAAFLAATEEPARRSQARRLTSAAGTLPPEPDPCRRGT